MDEENRRLVGGVSEIYGLEKPAATHAAPPSIGTYAAGDMDEGEGVHLRDYWHAIRKRLWLVFGIVVLVTTMATVYMARQANVYVAQARVQVDLENVGGSPLGNAKNASIIVNNPINDPTYFNTQLQILTSPGLMRRVVKTLDLEHSPEFLGRRSVVAPAAAASQSANELPLTSSVAPATPQDDLVEAKRLSPYVGTLQGGLKIEPVKETRTAGYNKDTRLIDIRFRHSDPAVAAKIVNAVADTFVLSNLERKSETNTSTGDFLQKRVAELQSRIRTGEEQLANYAKNNKIISLDAGQNVVVERLSGLNRQLLEAENERKLAEAEFRAARTPDASRALAETATKDIIDTEGKLNVLRQKRAQLLVRYTAEWPEVQEVDKQIAELERQVTSISGRASSNIKTNFETRYRQTLAREQAVRNAFNEQRGATVEQNEAAINYRILQQEIATNKTLLDNLLQRSRENDVVMAGMPNNIYVVDYALTPDAPVAPKRSQSVMLAFLLALAFGIGLALFLEYLNDTVRSSDDVERLLRLPALAVIPAVGGLARRRLPGANALMRRVDNQPELLIDADARSPLAEAYRHLRTSVLLSQAGHPPKTLLVSSSLPGEGKTTTTVNTAMSLAQTGARVVVIDADMRRPRLHSIFGEGNKRGLSTILSSNMDTAGMLANIVAHEASGLHLLCSGPVPPNPAELIGSEQMRRLIATLVDAGYDHIVIDSPPIASFTDSVLISTMVDGVLLVVHGGKSSRSVVRRSRQILQDVGAKILGVVLNNINLRSHDYYYQRYYQQSYYTSEPEAEHFAPRG